MHIRDEFSKLMSKFKRSVDSQSSPNLPELFKDSLLLFEKLKELLSTCSEEEKKEILKLMAEMHEFLASSTKRLASQTGLSEEQMLLFAENPDNFTPEQWKTLELIRKRFTKTAGEMAELLKKGPPSYTPSAELPEATPVKVERREKKGKHAKKDQWMKS